MPDLASVEPPRRLGPFLLLRHLASGGMGDVYLAHQQLGMVERLCVVKTVRPDLAGNRVAMRRFVDEARTTALISHKNIASVLDVGDVDGTTFIAVEYVAGRDLSAVFKRARRIKNPIPEDVALYVFGELLDALAYVHRATDPRSGEPLHIVHRDISPHNVLVSFEGEVKLIDFGIARSTVRSELTHAGQTLGKIRYMAPEQARGETVDGATDVYAACIVACELLTGRRFYGEKMSVESIAMLVATGGAPQPAILSKLPTALQRVLKAGLDPDPRARPSANELKDRLVALQMQRMSMGTSEGLREYLDILFEGEKEHERKARAALMHEPTTVRAADLAIATAQEHTPPDSGEDDATAARGHTVLLGEEDVAHDKALSMTSSVVREASDLSTGSVGIVETGSRSRRKAPPPRRWLVPLVAAALALPVGLLLVTLALWPREEAPPRLPIATLPVVVDPPVDPPTPDPPTGVQPTGEQPTGAPVPEAQPPTAPAIAVVDAGPERPRLDVKKPRRAPDKKERPQLFGDRVRALKACEPRPLCANGVLKRAADVGALSVEQLRDLDDDVDLCLQRCR